MQYAFKIWHKYIPGSANHCIHDYSDKTISLISPTQIWIIDSSSMFSHWIEHIYVIINQRMCKTKDGHNLFGMCNEFSKMEFFDQKKEPVNKVHRTVYQRNFQLNFK